MFSFGTFDAANIGILII